MQILRGTRIAKDAQLTPGCAAVIFDEKRERIFLTRRSDNNKWCLPGGRMEPGESAAECCEREVFEETQLHIKVIKLIGIYTDPNWVVQYQSPLTYQLVAMCFEAIIVEGEPGLSDETSEWGWFTPTEIRQMDLVEHHPQRIADALANQQEAFIR